MISAHAFVGAKMAFQINRRFGTPFCVTWHGSEIHSVSHTVGAYQFEMTRKIMSRASCNFFVSRALQESACVFSDKIISQILYNGVDERFYKYSDENLTISALMKIKLLKRYKPDKFSFDVLKDEYGIYAIRGPRGITNSLSASLNGK